MQTPIPTPPARLQRQLKKLSPQYMIDFHGMERSGHNAIAQWVAALMPPLSGLVPGTHSREFKFHGHPASWEAAGKARPVSAVFMYYPDCYLPEAPSRTGQERVVVCVRDIRNMLASRLRWQAKYKRALFKTGRLMLTIWKDYAKQVLGEEDFFNGHAVGIFYDSWVTKKPYRRLIATEMGKRFGWDLMTFDAAESARTKVTEAGGGSSFDGTTTPVEKMRVTERWKEFENDEYFNWVLQLDPEILELNQRLLEG